MTREEPAIVSASCLLMRARRLSRLVTQRYAERLVEHGLSVSGFTLLAAIGSSPGVRPVELAAALDLEKSTLSRELQALKREGLIEREPIDGRSYALVLSNEGLERFESTMPAWRAAQREVRLELGPVADALQALFPS